MNGKGIKTQAPDLQRSTSKPNIELRRKGPVKTEDYAKFRSKQPGITPFYALLRLSAAWAVSSQFLVQSFKLVWSGLGDTKRPVKSVSVGFRRFARGEKKSSKDQASKVQSGRLRQPALPARRLNVRVTLLKLAVNSRPVRLLFA